MMPNIKFFIFDILYCKLYFWNWLWCFGAVHTLCCAKRQQRIRIRIFVSRISDSMNRNEFSNFPLYPTLQKLYNICMVVAFQIISVWMQHFVSIHMKWEVKLPFYYHYFTQLCLYSFWKDIVIIRLRWSYE